MWLKSSLSAMNPRRLYWCGVIAPLVFVFMAVLGGALRPGYSHITDTVSELMSPGSPNRLLISLIFTTYALLMAGFGVGMLHFIRSSTQPSRYAALGAWLFIAAGVINVSIATVFPQDPWGTPITFPGMMHFVLSGVIGIFQLIAVVLLGVWLRRSRLSPTLGAYSLVNAVVLLLMMGFFLKMANTSIFGFAERGFILVGMVWTFVMALWVVGKGTKAKPSSV